MDFTVIKYLGIASVMYGTQLFLAVIQILLSVYLIVNGILQFSSKESLGKWPGRFGFAINKEYKKKSLLGSLMVAAGVGLIIPVFGLSHYIAIISCMVSFYTLVVMISSLKRV